MGKLSDPSAFSKALISAFDAVLDAERDAGVEIAAVGRLPNFTATLSFAVCRSCARFSTNPALGQMWELRVAMKYPQSWGYTPRNDLWTAYRTRFVNSFNTANPASDIRHMFLNSYDQHFEGTPVFIGEYHSPEKQVVLSEDLPAVLDIARDSSTLLQGIAFFEFQVRYDKGGPETMFGMFGLGDGILGDVLIGSSRFNVRCLVPMLPRVQRLQAATGCAMHPNTEYVFPAKWQKTLRGVDNPSDCCGRCSGTTRCRVWTWGPSGTGELTCTLRGSLPARPLDQRVNTATVSGASMPAKEIERMTPHLVAQAFGGAILDYGKLCLNSSAL